jgi:hypothetical protein
MQASKISWEAMSRRRRTDLVGIPGEKSAEAEPPEPLGRGVLEQKQRALLSPAFVQSVFAPHLYGLRSRRLPLPLVALLLVTFCLNGNDSFAGLLVELARGSLAGLPQVSVSPQAFYQRLSELGHKRFLLLLQQVTLQLQTNTGRRAWVQKLAPWAKGIYAVDDTTLDALARRVEELRGMAKGAPGTLAGRLGSVLDLCTGKLAELVYNPDSTANEKTHLLPLLKRLGPRALVVLDLGYFAFKLFDAITDSKQFFVTRMRKLATFEVLHVLVDRPLYRDRVVYLGANRSDRAAHPVRLVELWLEDEWWRYVTNVLDPQQLPAAHVWRLYFERWGIEQAFFAIKRVLGLANLRCTTPDGVLAQIWSTLTAFQILQDLRLEIAAAQGLGEDQVSWHRLVHRIAIYARVPEPKLPPREWLMNNPKLEKQGQRLRRAQTLPAEVLKQIEEGMAEMPPLKHFPPRKPREGKPRAVRPSVIVEAGLPQRGEGPPA